MIFIKRAVCFLSPNLGKGIENTQRQGSGIENTQLVG